MNPTTPADPNDLDLEAKDAEERAARVMADAVREYRRLIKYAERMRISADLARADRRATHLEAEYLAAAMRKP